LDPLALDLLAWLLATHVSHRGVYAT